MSQNNEDIHQNNSDIEKEFEDEAERSDDWNGDDKNDEFEADGMFVSTPRLRLVGAQALDSSCTESKGYLDDSSLIEDILQDKINMGGDDLEHRMFLSDMDSALEDLKRWKENRSQYECDELPEDIPTFEYPYTEDEANVAARIHTANTAKLQSLETLLRSPRSNQDEEDDEKQEKRRNESEYTTKFKKIELQAREESNAQGDDQEVFYCSF